MIRVFFNNVVILETEDEGLVQDKIAEFEAKNPNRRAVRETIGGIDTVEFYYRASEQSTDS